MEKTGKKIAGFGMIINYFVLLLFSNRPEASFLLASAC